MPIGKGHKVCDGNDVAVISIGPICYDVQQAVARAAEKGVSAAHYDMIFLKPIDEQLLKEVAEKGCPIVTVEDASIRRTRQRRNRMAKRPWIFKESNTAGNT